MSDAANWIRQNCKFAAPAPLPDPAQQPAVQHAPPLTTVSPPSEVDPRIEFKKRQKQVQEIENRLDRPKPPMSPVADEAGLAEDIRDMSLPPREVFDRMANDVRTIQEALSFVDNPSFPSFTAAYRKAFGDQPAAHTGQLLRQIEEFMTNIAHDPKFAEILAKFKKQG